MLASWCAALLVLQPVPPLTFMAGLPFLNCLNSETEEACTTDICVVWVERAMPSGCERQVSHAS